MLSRALFEVWLVYYKSVAVSMPFRVTQEALWCVNPTTVTSTVSMASPVGALDVHSTTESTPVSAASWTGLMISSTKNIGKSVSPTEETALRPVPTRPISCWPTPKVTRLPSTDFIGSRILNMLNRESLPIIPESVVELADSVAESANSTADFTADPVKIGLWVWPLCH